MDDFLKDVSLKIIFVLWTKNETIRHHTMIGRGVRKSSLLIPQVITARRVNFLLTKMYFYTMLHLSKISLQNLSENYYFYNYILLLFPYFNFSWKTLWTVNNAHASSSVCYGRKAINKRRSIFSRGYAIVW